MPTINEVKNDIEKLLACLNMTALGKIEWDDVKAFEREINTFIGMLEDLRSKVKTYAKIKTKTKV